VTAGGSSSAFSAGFSVAGAAAAGALFAGDVAGVDVDDDLGEGPEAHNCAGGGMK
jgi:hypothetical protein